MTTTDDIKLFHVIDFLAACFIAVLIISGLGDVAAKVGRVEDKVNKLGTRIDNLKETLHVR